MAILNQRLDTVTLFSEITNGWQYVSEDGTVYPFTFVYNNADPDNVSFDILFNGNVVQSIPLIAYDVNIATSGGFTFNPLTSILTITETDGETHTVDLNYLRTTITSANGTVGISQTTNPDNSTNYDLSVKTPYHEFINAPYTGVELPTIVGQVAGDTDEVKFSDGTIVNYTFDGTTWVVDFDTPKCSVCDPQFEDACTTYNENILVQKTDGSFVVRPSNSLKRNEVYPTGDYTISGDDDIIYAQGGSTITFPPCATTCKEKTIYRDACSDGIITLLPPSGEKFDGIHLQKILQVGRGSFTYECVNGEWRTKEEYFEEDASCCEFSLLDSPNASIQVFTTDGLPYSIDWGDGSNSGLIASGITANHSYATNYTGSIKICKTCGTAPIYNVIFNSGEWDFDIKDLNCLTGLTSVTVYTGAISGDIATAPSGLTYLAIYGQNTLSGDIATAPSGLTVLSISGQNTLSGNIATAPSGLTYLSIRGQNTLSGDIATAPSGLTNMSIIGQNTISGDIATAPSGLTVMSICGQNTLSGSLDSLQNTLTYYSITGLNSISTYSGVNLNSGFTYFLSQSPNACFNSSAVDALFIELETTIPGITYINITGCAAPPTGASLTARNNLIASGCTVIHN